MKIVKDRLMDEENGGNGGGEGPTVEQLQEQLAAANQSVQSLEAKTNELLGEKKTEAAKRREAEAKVAADAIEAARAKGDFEQLHKASEIERKRLQDELNGVKDQTASEKRKTEALKIATEIASNGDNAQLLSDHISKRLKFVNDELKVTDEKGELTVSTVDDLKTIFKNNKRFASLLKGNQSSGGSAPGSNDNGGGAAKTKTRADFEALNPVEQSKFMLSGGIIET